MDVARSLLANIGRVAIVHDWLVTYAGAERVLSEVLGLFPEADLFVLVDFLPASDRSCLEGHCITTSFIQHLPFARRYYRHYLPLMPLAVEQFDLSSYDLVISSSHAVAKGVITAPHQRHISYVHSPMRYAWDLQHQYLKESGLQSGVKAFFVKYLLHRLRLWDLRTSNGVDVFVANSHFIAKRIWKVYRRPSKVIYPPVAVSDFVLQEEKKDYYVTASRMVAYKKMDIIISAFTQMPDKKLVVIGDGPEWHRLNNLSKNAANIQLLGYQSREVLVQHLQAAKAFLFAAEEDFGIVPVEAMACGTPVIAYGKGGVLETVIDGKTGLFFTQQTAESVCDAVMRFEQRTWLPHLCRQRAEQFATSVFINQFSHLLLQDTGLLLSSKDSYADVIEE